MKEFPSSWSSRPIMVLAIVPAIAAIAVGAWAWSTSEAQTRRQLTPAPIDGKRAFGYLKTLCEIGPHPAGSEANERYRKIVADHFKKTGAEIREQTFNARDPKSGRPVAMTNLIGSWFPDRNTRIAIVAHYDSRPFPDQEEDAQLRQTPFLGANDPGSGVALLMEIAHHLNEMKTPYGIDLVLVDGEELVYDRTGVYFLGSKHFAQQYKADKGKSPARYVAGVVLDMVGDRDLNISKEQNSVRYAPQIVREIWEVAAALKAKGFVQAIGPEVLDDHLPLNEERIPTADIIDFDYDHWHRAGDTIDKLSPDSLVEVGRVVTAWLCIPGKTARK